MRSYLNYPGELKNIVCRAAPTSPPATCSSRKSTLPPLPAVTPRPFSPNSRPSAPVSSFVPNLPKWHSCFFLPKFLIPQKSAYNVCMRAGTFLRSASTLLLVICLLIAPLCSARCAVNSCLPPTAPAQAAGCHHHSTSPQSESVAAFSLSCQTSDSLLTTLPTNTIRSLQPTARHITASTSFFPVVVTMVAFVSFYPGQFDSSPGRQSLPWSVTPLRL